MLYNNYQIWADLTDPVCHLAATTSAALVAHGAERDPFLPLRQVAAACDVVTCTRITHGRPDYGIRSVTVDGCEWPVREVPVHRTPFGTLLRFQKEGGEAQPRVLLIAPISGHFATLLRGTVRTMLRDHDVYITDWHNARDVPLWSGRFDLDEFVEHVVRFLEVLGPGAHIVAVCQPCVGALAAVAVMAEQGHPAQPASMTLMAGPIDTRVNPTAVNELATSRPIGWFEQNLIALVPWRYAGAWRRVYPGFLQLSAFMSMNFDRHLSSFWELYRHLREGDAGKAAAIRSFYAEYFAVMDLPAEFYLQTVQRVFQEYALALGKLTFRGRPIDPGFIRRTALFTVEGEKDDICSIGQTVAAQDLCRRVPAFRRQHHVQTGAGHYGVFNGRRWEREIYPLLRDFISATGS